MEEMKLLNIMMIIVQWFLRLKKAEEQTKGTGLKIFTPKQMLQRLPIVLAQLKQVIIQKVY